jgi:predicted Na+-dependent transporter
VRPFIGRRAVFFLVLALVCAAMIPVTPAEFRWVNLTMTGIALFWALMMAGEDLARRRRGRARARESNSG